MWRIAVHDLDGTERVHDLGWSGFTFSHVHNGPGSFECDISMAKVARADIEPGQSDYRVYDGSTLRAAGRIWTARVDPRNDFQRATIIGEGYWSVLRRRLIDWEVRYEPVTESPANLNTAYELSQEEIAWDLIDRSQGEPGGDLGLTLGSHTGGAQLRRRWWCEEDGLVIAEIIESFTELKQGIDFAITPTLTDAALKTFRTWSPSRGSPSGVVFDGTNFLDTLTYEIDAHDIVSRAKAKVTGDCDPYLADQTDATSLADYGLLEDLTDVDSEESDDADEAAQEMLDERKTVLVSDAIDYELSRGPALGTYDVGDTATVQSPRVGWELDITARVTAVEVSVQLPETTFVHVDWTQV
jgi:hypothetical protein